MSPSTRRPVATWVLGAGVCALAIACAAVVVRTGDGDPPDHGAPQTATVHGPTAGVTEPGHQPADRREEPDYPNDHGGAQPTSGRDEAGAVEMAVGFAAAPQSWLYFDDREIAAAVAEVASPRAMADLTAETVAAVRAARDELAQSSGRVWWLVHPLAWRVESFSGTEATVAVWVVTLLSAAGVAMPQTEWVTDLVDLVWVDDGWRVDDSIERPGPTPLTGPGDRPWEAEPFDSALDGFTRLDGEPIR
jgi:hypothetical protein